MLNVNKVTSELSMMPDPALQQFASLHKDDPYMLSLAVAESNRRKDMRMAPQLAAQQPPKVADQAIAGMAPAPESMGIGRLPAQNIQRMAGGGIVAFADGGTTDDTQAVADRAAMQDTLARLGIAGADIATMIPRGVTGAFETAVTRPLRAFGVPVPYGTTDTRSATPYYDVVRQAEEGERKVAEMLKGKPKKETPAATVTPAPETPPVAQQPVPSDTDTGIALYNRIRGGVKIPSVTSTYVAEPYEQAAQKVEAAAAGRNKETDAAYAPVFEQLAKERADIGARANIKEALIRAGLGMLGGTSQYAAVNIGRGGIEGLDAYQRAQAVDAAAKQHNMQSQIALMQAQRAERSGNMRDATTLYAQSRQDANTAAQLTLQAQGLNQRAAEAQQEMRLRAIVAKQPPAIMQITDRIRLEKNIPFSEALQQAYGMQAAPRGEADLRKAWSSNIMLQQQFPNFADYAAAVGATIGGAGAPAGAGLSAADAALVNKYMNK